MLSRAQTFRPYTNHVQNRYQDIVRDLRPTEIVVELYQKKIITEREREIIMGNLSTYDKNVALLKHLRGEEAHKCFFDALKESAQNHLQEGFIDGKEPDVRKHIHCCIRGKPIWNPASVHGFD